MGKKRVNVVLDENVHKGAVIAAARAGWDFSQFVNLMLEFFLYTDDRKGFEALLKGMFEMEGRRRGFIVPKDTLQLRDKKKKRESAKGGKR